MITIARVKKGLLLSGAVLALSACGAQSVVAEATADVPHIMSGTAEAPTVINVAEYGIVPGRDVTMAVNDLLISLKGKSNVTLDFPAGQYDFYPDYAVEEYRYVANHDNGLKRMGLPIYDTKDLTINGNGSTFMFHGRMVPITVERSEGVTIKGIAVDFIRPFFAELEIVESSDEEKYLIAEIDSEKFPYEVKNGELLFDRLGQIDPIGTNIIIDPETRAPLFRTKEYQINGRGRDAKDLGNGRVRIDNLRKLAPPVGTVMVVYGVHPTSRFVPGIHVTNSKDLKIENSSVLSAGGMALIVERTENIHLDGFTVTSGEGLTTATRADATHFIGCKGHILVENSLMEHMLDDGINVHGAYVNIDDYIGNNTFRASISHFQQMGLIFGEPGDKVAVLSRETVLPKFEAEITDIRVLNDKRFLITLDNVPETLPSGPLSIENLTWNPDLTFRNNIVRENRARSGLVTTKGTALFEGNTFSSQMHGILIEGDNKHWYESGAVQDVTIRGNTFINTGYSALPAYPLLAAPLLTKEQRWGDGHYHSNIKFVDNTLRSFNGLLVQSFSVDGLEISGNKLEFSTDYPEVIDFPSIDLKYSKNVVIRDNVATGFGRPLEITISEDSEKITIENNQGWTQ